MLGVAVPMWIWPWYCQGALGLLLTGGVVEWWLSAYVTASATLQDFPWLLAASALWTLPSLVVVTKHQEVLGHRRMVQCVLIQLAFGDTAQLLCGRAFGRTLACPLLSPRKTLEGYAGGLLLTWAYGFFMHGWGARDILLAFVAGCVGDLYFSSVKRRLGLKDFSKVFGSHGGVLDRIDSFLFAVNALFWTYSLEHAWARGEPP